MSDTGSKDKAVTADPNPLNEEGAMEDIGLYEVLEVVVDIKIFMWQCLYIQPLRPVGLTTSTEVLK